VPLVLMALGMTATFWLVGLGFGLMVILPISFFAAVTFRGGAVRHRELWRFYELKWNVSLRSLAWLYIPLAILGVVSFIMVVGSVL